VRATILLLSVLVLTGCGGDEPEAAPQRPASFAVDPAQADVYATAYLAEAVPVGSDTGAATGEATAGEHVVIANNADIRIDMGGWYVEDADSNRLSLGIGRQIDVGTTLRVYTACGTSTEEAVFACADVRDVLGDDGDVLTLRDSAGSEVAQLRY